MNDRIHVSMFQAVQAGGDGGGGGGSGSTVISWVVDDDNSVVKYCQDNIVTIFVPGSGDTSDVSDDGGDDTSGGCGGDTTLAIVANNTLRLRIVPCEPDHLGAVGSSNDVQISEISSPLSSPPFLIQIYIFDTTTAWHFTAR